MDIKVLVATHKEYKMPEDNIYLPIQVGSELSENYLGYQCDNVSENISHKNHNYSELTALYWGWKNLDCDYLGLVHYRRHFSLSKQKARSKEQIFDFILNSEEVNLLLAENSAILPKKRNYVIETLHSHYSNTHNRRHLTLTESIIAKKFPDYLISYKKILYQKKGHMFNMFIMKKDLSDKYCKWLFSILEELEENIDESKLSSYDARLYGRISEILLNVWLDKQKVTCKEIEHLHLEKINWFNKGMCFLRAKIFKKAYTESF